ncbi:hypothetical protein D7V97_31645 [Corallococcus sp. CA053C]|uniref:hypothetical protein n=1 Tax=Corallococcus sp. CA053C TaxID=2316732 RepID=UPI000EA3C319|nr:hypothetical protein [Corallococcus sp. CA053C]RKG99487.1 hypothetical protein D7V97_31645 [Corallococcus sp. CA053C]
MTSIRRVGSGISTSRAHSISAQLEVTAPVRQEALAPVDPVRRGFSDASDFQADAEGDLSGALLADSGLAEAGPAPRGRASPEAREAPESRAALLENSQLRTFAGVSEFEAATPSYAQRLGTSQPSSSPLMQARLFNEGRRTEAVSTDPSLDPSDILSPDAAAWELQNLDTMPRTVSAQEAEDLLFLLESGDLSHLSDEELRALSEGMDMEDGSADPELDASGTETAGPEVSEGDFLATLEDSGPDFAALGSMNVPPPDDFLADVNDFTLDAPEAQEASVVVAPDAQVEAEAGTEAPIEASTEAPIEASTEARIEAHSEAHIEDVQDADVMELESAPAADTTPPPPPHED